MMFCRTHPQGPTDRDGRCAACNWIQQMGLGKPRVGFGGSGGLRIGGRAVRGFGLGASSGTSDSNLLDAANAVMGLNDQCGPHRLRRDRRGIPDGVERDERSQHAGVPGLEQ